jgi:hypothetical protein
LNGLSNGRIGDLSVTRERALPRASKILRKKAEPD